MGYGMDILAHQHFDIVGFYDANFDDCIMVWNSLYVMVGVVF